MKQKLFILLFFCSIGIEVRAQYQDEKELSSFFSYIIDSIVAENNPGKDTILIKSKTSESLYKYCDDLNLEKFISVEFSESDKTEILNGLRTARSISLYEIIPEKEKIKLADSITTDWLETRILRSTNLICYFSPLFLFPEAVAFLLMT